MAYNRDTYRKIREQKALAQKRRKQQQLRKIIVTIVILLIAAIAVFVFSSNNKEEKTAKDDNDLTYAVKTSFEPVKGKAINPSPSPEAEDSDTSKVKTSTKSTINQKYFDDSIFVGSAFMDTMKGYSLVDGSAYYTDKELSIVKEYANTKDSQFAIIDEISAESSPSKIFVMLGDNDYANSTSANFRVAYNAFLKSLRTAYPDANVYLISIPPVAKSAVEKGYVSSTNIKKFNGYIKELAQANYTHYVDLFSALADEEGYLPEDAATDGINFSEDYFVKMLVYIQENF